MPINQTITSSVRYQPKTTMEAQPLPDSPMNDAVNQSKDSEDNEPGSLPHITIPGSNQDSDSSPTASISPGIATRALGPCAECGLRINQLSDACHALGYLYHNACFVCCYCQRTLSGKVFYKDQEKIYCEEDYLYCGFQQVAEKCCACGHLISERILQAMGNSYHPGCFNCSVCTKCLDGVPFTVDSNNLLYCLPDYHLVHAPQCGACGYMIVPDGASNEVLRVAALDKEFHLDCYRCCDCKKLLGDEIEKRCYPMIEPDPNVPERMIHRLLCLNCHLNRIGAVPATTASSLSLNHKPITSSMNSPFRLFTASSDYQ
ncbi:hypothetical protein T265_01193 [Opisthorchis viverrini]|uniref:LIM zinc-binding domain-containing protein n=2 Tax=Opisthorchis viverrini TaxID=6198 RepID=A0A075AJ80_OPIVI|nr:hypothetical protein T265_01193 [Opisthorchis viverrini]KER32919.1 hypothetical protein T265_01193 [Opisthorchis viverrini]